MNAVELRKVSKRFDTARVLTDLDLAVPERSVTAVLGASGSGKTTLLRLIAGFEQVDSGAIAIDSRVVDDGQRSLRAQDRGIGYVPQEGALFPHLTVSGNIGFGLPRRDRKRARELVELVGLGGLGRRFPHQLSGGQQQRVALARALAIAPSVVLLDEPFSSLDATLRDSVRRDVAQVLTSSGATTILVTHDQDEALALSDRIALLDGGRVIACAHPRDLYRDPPDLTAATALGEHNLLDGVAGGRLARCLLGSVPLRASNGALADGPCDVLLRPEQLVLHLQDEPGATAGVVQEIRYHGHDALATVVLDGPGRRTVVSRISGDLHLDAGRAVWVAVVGEAHAWRKPTQGPEQLRPEDANRPPFLTPEGADTR